MSNIIEEVTIKSYTPEERRAKFSRRDIHWEDPYPYATLYRGVIHISAEQYLDEREQRSYPHSNQVVDNVKRHVLLMLARRIYAPVYLNYSNLLHMRCDLMKYNISLLPREELDKCFAPLDTILHECVTRW